MKKVIMLLVALITSIALGNLYAQKPSLKVCSMETLAKIKKFILSTPHKEDPDDGKSVKLIYEDKINGFDYQHIAECRKDEIIFSRHRFGAESKENPSVLVTVDSLGYITWAYTGINGQLTKRIDTNPNVHYNDDDLEMNHETEADVQRYKDEIIRFCKRFRIAYQ